MTATSQEFEGRPVRKSTVRLVGLGDGLSDDWGIGDEPLEHGVEVCFVVRGTVKRIAFEDKDDAVIRVHTIKGTAITKVEDEMAGKILAAARERVDKARAQAEGQAGLFDDDQAEDGDGEVDEHGHRILTIAPTYDADDQEATEDPGDEGDEDADA